MITNIISKNGTVTIPSDMRKRKNLKPGTKILFIEENNDLKIKVLNKNYFHSLIGITKTHGKALRSFLNEKMSKNY